MLEFRRTELLRLEESKGKLSLGDVTSVNLTILSGGLQPNIVPPELSATFDIRLTPTIDFPQFERQLNLWREEAGAEGKFEYLQKDMSSTGHGCITVDRPDESSDQVWSILAEVCRKANGTKVLPSIFQGATDARFVRRAHLINPKIAKPGRALGFSPMRRTKVCFFIFIVLVGAMFRSKLTLIFYANRHGPGPA
ncbi:unnamed protein product [Protopolystoma xenopodis]|uniref:Peptidase M20 dimerisation domain-containing protein n=1 Tax=Protopolystoma xenopodis TaxID=117903 RepID=A0A448XBS9_9PLAT|nr:unnamed protein product [Protopolystoma xenopodis]